MMSILFSYVQRKMIRKCQFWFILSVETCSSLSNTDFNTRRNKMHWQFLPRQIISLHQVAARSFLAISFS